jgi:hypothetical protein
MSFQLAAIGDAILILVVRLDATVSLNERNELEPRGAKSPHKNN